MHLLKVSSDRWQFLTKLLLKSQTHRPFRPPSYSISVIPLSVIPNAQSSIATAGLLRKMYIPKPVGKKLLVTRLVAYCCSHSLNRSDKHVQVKQQKVQHKPQMKTVCRQIKSCAL